MQISDLCITLYYCSNNTNPILPVVLCILCTHQSVSRCFYVGMAQDRSHTSVYNVVTLLARKKSIAQAMASELI